MNWKHTTARLLRLPFMKYLMIGGVRLMVPRHRVGVVMVAFNEVGSVLLLRHVFRTAASWGLPGGWLKRHESPIAGVLRELKEETGLTAVLDSTILVENRTQPLHLGIAFLGHVEHGPMIASPEIIEGGWFAPTDLPGPLMPFTTYAIETAVNKRVCMGVNHDPK